MNKYIDPNKSRNQPGVYLLTGDRRKKTKEVRCLRDLSHVKITPCYIHPSNDFDIELWTRMNNQFILLKTQKRNINMLKGLLSQLPNNLSLKKKLKESWDIDTIQSVTDDLLLNYSDFSDGPVCDFLNFCPSTVDLDDSRFFVTFNDIMTAFMMFFMFIFTVYFGSRASRDLKFDSSIPLIISLELSLLTELFGRTRRLEAVKNAFSLQRWLYLIPFTSTMLLLFSGITAASFFLLVFVLRFIIDSCRVMLRIVVKDETLKRSSKARNVAHFIIGFCALIPAFVLSIIVANASDRGYDHLIFFSSCLSLFVGFAYCAMSIV